MTSTRYLDASLDQTGPLAKLYSTSVQDGLLYPSDLADLEHFAVFRIRERQFETSSLKTVSRPATIFSQNIFLPMPAQLQTGYGVNYQNAELGGQGAAAVKATGATIAAAAQDASVSGNVQKLIEAGQSVMDNFGLDSVTGALKTGGEFAAREYVATNEIGRAGASVANFASNPYQAVFFTSPNFRTHSFSYTLFAKNKQESDSIRQIIRAFKTAMLPGLPRTGMFFSYPKVFEIEFRHDDYLFEIGTSALTQFDVNYHGEGTASYFDETKAPTNVQISMSFQELNILTSEDVDGISNSSEFGNRK
jgi:hypothetical protein